MASVCEKFTLDLCSANPNICKVCQHLRSQHTQEAPPKKIMFNQKMVFSENKQTTTPTIETKQPPVSQLAQKAAVFQENKQQIAPKIVQEEKKPSVSAATKETIASQSSQAGSTSITSNLSNNTFTKPSQPNVFKAEPQKSEVPPNNHIEIETTAPALNPFQIFKQKEAQALLQKQQQANNNINRGKELPKLNNTVSAPAQIPQKITIPNIFQNQQQNTKFEAKKEEPKETKKVSSQQYNHNDKVLQSEKNAAPLKNSELSQENEQKEKPKTHFLDDKTSNEIETPNKQPQSQVIQPKTNPAFLPQDQTNTVAQRKLELQKKLNIQPDNVIAPLPQNFKPVEEVIDVKPMGQVNQFAQHLLVSLSSGPKLSSSSQINPQPRPLTECLQDILERPVAKRNQSRTVNPLDQLNSDKDD